MSWLGARQEWGWRRCSLRTHGQEGVSKALEVGGHILMRRHELYIAVRHAGNGVCDARGWGPVIIEGIIP